MAVRGDRVMPASGALNNPLMARKKAEKSSKENERWKGSLVVRVLCREASRKEEDVGFF